MLSVFVAGCQDGSSSGTKDDPDRKYKIGIALVTKGSQYWSIYGDMMEARAEAWGFDYTLVFSNADQAQQIQDIMDLVESGIDLLIVSPIQLEGSQAGIDYAGEKGIPVVTTGRMSTSQYVTASCVADEVQFGVAQAKQLMIDFPDGANYVYMFAPVGASYPQEQYYNGFTPTIDSSKWIELARMDGASDTSDVGLQNSADAIVRFGDQIDAILCCNDDQAFGVVQAVEEAGLTGQIAIYGGTGVILGLQYVKEGKMVYTAMKSQSAFAEIAMQQAHAILNDLPFEKHQLNPPKVVTTANVETIVDFMFGGTWENPAVFTVPD